MNSTAQKHTSRDRKRAKIRAKVSGTADRPRLSIFKSNTAIYAQLINDDAGITIASANGKDAVKVGQEIAKAGAAKKVSAIVFDRGGYVYKGSVKALADAAREGGLTF